ncbi:MAG TPA: hypothetical protein VGU27_10410, partial [Candidatus Eisenbacteria bacterium]|nr:hypothetical protein [Candidatus Eisenbacteria bacterium]
MTPSGSRESLHFPRARARAWGLALALLWAPLARAAPPAGTPIDNTARGTARDSLSGLPLAPVSNTVRAVVQPLEWVALAPDRGGLAAPGAAVTLAHRLWNRGNVATDVRLDAANLAGDGFDVAAIALAEDRDGSGTLTPGDVPIANGGVVTLAAGDSTDLLITLTAPAAAPGPAQAWVRLTATGLLQGASAAVTDTLATPAPLAPPALAFFDAPDYRRTARVTALGAPLYLEASAPQCDTDPLAPDTVTITVTALRSGDRDTFRAVETGAHTGVFRIQPDAPAASATTTSAQQGDGVVEQLRGDLVTAVLAGCGAARTSASVWVDPTAIVFDARTDRPVAGARVQLVDVTGQGNGGIAGGLARVLQADGVTPAPADVTTPAAGTFAFPLVPRSTYRLVVTPPSPYRFPSLVDVAALPPGHLADASGSYGGTFAIADSLAPVRLDVPVDAVGTLALFAEKTASATVVEWGDGLDYDIRVANRSDSTLDSVSVHDALPAGFAYVPGSARRDGAALADPAGGRGPALTFALGALAPQAQATLHYRVAVGAGAPRGEALNTAVADARGVRSNTAGVAVRVQGDAFADEATVLGSVRLRPAGTPPGAAAPGLAGVRLYLDDGTFAITDARGRYNFAGLTPRTHALKLDPSTLPRGAVLVALDHRDAGTPGLRFVDLSRGELARADFEAVGDTTAVREADGRRLIAAGQGDEAGRALARAQATPLEQRPVADPRSLPAERIVTGESGLPVYAPPDAVPAAAAPAPPAVAVAAATPLEQLLPGLDPDLGFVDLADLDTVATRQIAVRVKGGLGTPLVLRVNGEIVPDSRVGRRVQAPRAGLEAWEYVGVALKPGVNVLEVAPPHSLGRVALRVVAPGPFAKLELAAPARVPADGHGAARVRVRVLDADGVPVGERTLVTLESTLGRLAADDLDPGTPGTQIAVEGGEADVDLVAPGSPGTAHLTASAGEVRATAGVAFVPELRPLLAVGALEGVVSLHGFSRRGAGANPADATFEAPIDQFLAERRDGRADAAAHGALFVKGRVRDDLQLTLGYDSDRPPDERQFRDQQPDRGFPVVGDASVRGYEAQSTGRLYARLEQRDASLLYGDFVAAGTGTRTLANYGRSLTGVETRWGGEAAQLHAFTSRTRSSREVEELRGAGVSGPFALAHAPLTENSEQVEIVVRDRAQPAVVLSARLLQRFTDYELDAQTGTLLLRAPVPSLDPDLNPVYVRVAYEAPNLGPAAWVHGVDGRVHVSSAVEVSGLYVDDHDPAQPYELRGASALAKLGPHTSLEGEWAVSRRLAGDAGALAADSAGTAAAAGAAAGPAAGDAGRLELKHEDGVTQARLWGVTTAPGFSNPGAGFTGGRNEAGARLVTRLADRTRFTSEALFTGDALGAGRRGGLLLALDRALSAVWHGELGVRVAGEARQGAPAEPTSAAVRGKLTAQLPDHPAWSGYGELEQDTREFDRRLAALGGEYRFSSRGRVYARHELASSLSGAWALSGSQQQLASVVGVDADVARDAHVFSEYRLEDALAGREAQAAVGLRNAWRLDDGMRVGGSFERVSPLAGPTAGSGASTALTGSVDWTEDPVWKGSSRMEIRTDRASDQFLEGMAAAVRLDSTWTALGRHLLTLTDAHANGVTASERLLLAFACRAPGAGGWDGLGRWEVRYDRDPASVADHHRRIANIVAAEGAGPVAHDWRATLAWAGKLTRDEEPGLVAAGGAQWLHGRLLRDLGRDWDAGLTAGALAGRRLTQRTYGLGVEVGRVLPGGAWLSAGFNEFGYRDDELTGEEWTREGAYLRLRVKFDEAL